MTSLLFLDTETTGLDPDDHIWEIAVIHRSPDHPTFTRHWFVQHDTTKAERLPDAFRRDHDARYQPNAAITPADLVERLYALTLGRPHVVGAVPDFDVTRLNRLARAHGVTLGWHYHLIDVETLAVGWLAARGTPVPLPWSSDDVSQMVGVIPPTDGRHTALGDAVWAMNVYDAVIGSMAGG